MEETIAQEARRLLSPIPEEQFTVCQYENNAGDKCCSMGHINKAKSGNPFGSEFERVLRRSAADFLMKKARRYHDYYGNLVGVNDGKDPLYQQKTPKRRVMKLLDDMIAAGL